jgi:hypothetical protein
VKKQLFKKILSVFLLVVFFYSTTPGDFLHKLFANHKDSIDKPVGKVYQFSKKHIHCAFLCIRIAHYDAARFPFYQSILGGYYVIAAIIPVSYRCTDIRTASLRAPPLAA